MKLLERLKTSRPDSLSKKLPDDAFVMLDPAVEVLDAEIAEHRLLSHGYLEIGMVVPPGEGLVDFVTTLSNEPVNVAVLRAQFDDQSMIDEMLASLRQHGFMHITSQTKPSTEELEHLRRIAECARTASLRRSIVIDLDGEISLEQISTRLKDETHPPELLLRCAQLADYKLTLGELARLREKGIIRMHQTVVQTHCLSSNSELRRSLIRLGAAVYLDGISWAAPNHPIAGLEEMVRDCVAIHLLMTPGLSIVDEAERRRVLTWATSAFISGLCLRLDPDALWPAGDAAEDDFDAIFKAVRAIENALGDVLIVNLPSDEVLLGNAASSASPGRVSDFAKRFRAAYLRWRLPLLKACENDNSWSQVPEVEDKLVRAQEDLLPNHPELLLLKPGSIVVDVCGGLGRVARRLSPAVGEDGLVISVEMFRCLSDRARRFACERNFTNLDFRPGLAQRLALPDASVDAAVNEWTGGIWELGLGASMVKEMARVVRPGGRIAVTHRLVQLHLASLRQPWVQYDEIYAWIREAFVHPDLTIIAERIWGQIVPSLIGEHATLWRKQYMPRLINPYDVIYRYDDSPDTRADVYLTVIAQRR
ncbi:class I SAM-dependent methyltransferase [Bradyrhizobium sp. NBAIM20]|uniref:class I SAM-dependent methyltransferase n=1 Tax=unclassified Bradyrhizobium TaxID=2631580 RepID=UPI001CD58443|nr:MULTISPECIES: class I SAM-dependent methyltransferase [unclassified Bradyrhizobium]MCA1411675.1 class I SAM-dependent methyltransferase [Bradyrhizobium sp. NBAIM20]MCA1460990.1 class I SAM-dependent methyltransferase [Bradyrhizobium sp. NBAIM18]